MGAQGLPLAAVHHDGSVAIDAFLETVVRRLQASGLTVAGVIQRETANETGCCAIMDLEDIQTGRLVRISQSLGREAKGCRLDPRGVAEVAGVQLMYLDARPDFLILNRFGKGDADGHGFRAVIGKAMELGVPVLTAVRDTYMPAWNVFTGGDAAVLQPVLEGVVAWAMRANFDSRNVQRLAG